MTQSSAEVHYFESLIDYDWTLFDTTAFSNDLWKMIAAESGVALDKVTEDGSHFHADAVLGGYDYDKHIEAYELEAGKMWGKLGELVVAANYLYDDSAPFMQELGKDAFNPRVYSFGVEKFQRTKIVPYLPYLEGRASTPGTGDSNMPYSVVFEKKGPSIARNYPGSTGVLLDDVRGQGLPENFTEINIDRSRTELVSPLEIPEGFVVANLAQAAQVIRSLRAER